MLNPALKKMRDQVKRLLGEASATADHSEIRKLAGRAFALAQAAEAKQREAEDQHSELRK
jgi:hypothetical protein